MDTDFPVFTTQATSPIVIEENLAPDNHNPVFTFDARSETSQRYFLAGELNLVSLIKLFVYWQG